MLALPHSLHGLLRRWCWQMLAPPHSLHLLLMHWCWQMLITTEILVPKQVPSSWPHFE